MFACQIMYKISDIKPISMRFLKLSYFILLIIFTSCNDELIINAEYKDITIVYGLLSPQDTIHYIKIGKAFLNNNNNAMLIAREMDSLYYKDSLVVVLDEYKNNRFIKSINLNKVFKSDKDSGIFAFPGQYLYATPKTQLDPMASYQLKISNLTTGKLIRSSTSLVNQFSSIRPQAGGNIPFYSNHDYKIEWFSGKNAYFYDLTVVIHYYEYNKLSPTIKTNKSISWPIFTYRKTTKLEGNELMSRDIPGSSFFDFLSSAIAVDQNLQREFGTLDFIFTAGGEEIFYYIDVNEPSVGTVQKKPEYTNIENGYGIFSSRNQSFVKAYLSPSSILEVKSNSKTINLNFVK